MLVYGKCECFVMQMLYVCVFVHPVANSVCERTPPCGTPVIN